jgi:hypothetical protein
LICVLSRHCRRVIPRRGRETRDWARTRAAGVEAGRGRSMFLPIISAPDHQILRKASRQAGMQTSKRSESHARTLTHKSRQRNARTPRPSGLAVRPPWMSLCARADGPPVRHADRQTCEPPSGSDGRRPARLRCLLGPLTQHGSVSDAGILEKPARQTRRATTSSTSCLTFMQPYA